MIELGANDALRGLSLKASTDNLNRMVELCQAKGAKVVLIGMRVPPNYGKRYTDEFAEMFTHVSKNKKTALVPFLLKGVADRQDARDWFQSDGNHPLAKAHPIILDNVWAVLQPLLR